MSSSASLLKLYIDYAQLLYQSRNPLHTSEDMPRPRLLYRKNERTGSNWDETEQVDYQFLPSLSAFYAPLSKHFGEEP